MTKRFVLALLVALSVVFSGAANPAHAADTPIKYGETINGEITDDADTATYTFTGAANDVIVVKMGKDYSQTDNSLKPLLSLVDSKKKEVATTKDGFSFSSALIAIQLKDAGTYSIVATRQAEDGGEKSKGKYSLSLSKAETLEAGKTVKGNVSSEGTSAFYSLTIDKPFTLSYEKTKGKYSPAVQVNTINKSDLTEVATLSGSALSKGTLTVAPTKSTLYIVSVGEALFDLNFDKVTADYTLKLGE